MKFDKILRFMPTICLPCQRWLKFHTHFKPSLRTNFKSCMLTHIIHRCVQTPTSLIFCQSLYLFWWIFCVFQFHKYIHMIIYTNLSRLEGTKAYQQPYYIAMRRSIPSISRNMQISVTWGTSKIIAMKFVYDPQICRRGPSKLD